MTCISIFLLPAQRGRKGGKVISESQDNSPGHQVNVTGVTQTWRGHREMAWSRNLLYMSDLLMYKPLEELSLEYF